MLILFRRWSIIWEAQCREIPRSCLKKDKLENAVCLKKVWVSVKNFIGAGVGIGEIDTVKIYGLCIDSAACGQDRQR